MKKFITTLAKFSLFCAFGYFLLVCVFGMSIPSYYSPNITSHLGGSGHLNSRIKEANNKAHVDILILGSSHAYRGLDTRIIERSGKSAFNLGSSSQTPIQTEILVNRYLSHLEPSLVIFEVYPSAFTLDGAESSLDLIINSRVDLPLAKLVIKQKNIKLINSGVYASMRQFLNLETVFTEENTNSSGTYISGGFVEDSVRTYRYDDYDKQRWDFKPYQFEAFDRILSSIKLSGAECLLVFSPITPSRYNSYTNQVYFDSLMTSKASYFNFNQLIQLDDSLHFSDSHHLNQHGVEIYNRKLLQVMDSLGLSD